MSGKAVRPRIDESLCARVGYCENSAPHVFRLDASGPSRVLVDEVTDPDQITQVHEAEELCPTTAVIVEEFEPGG
jgi:ferredoxin